MPGVTWTPDPGRHPDVLATPPGGHWWKTSPSWSRRANGICTITINRGQKQNTLNPEVLREMIDAIRSTVTPTSSTRVVVLRGAGREGVLCRIRPVHAAGGGGEALRTGRPRAEDNAGGGHHRPGGGDVCGLPLPHDSHDLRAHVSGLRLRPSDGLRHAPGRSHGAVRGTGGPPGLALPAREHPSSHQPGGRSGRPGAAAYR